MKKILFLVLVIFAFLGYLSWQPFDSLRSLRVDQSSNSKVEPKRTILRIGLVADSHNENELLGKALQQAQGMGINFVIGLGDYTNLGTVDELMAAKSEFEKSKLEYFLIPGDRDGWESRNKGETEPVNFIEVFGPSNQIIEKEGVEFVLVDNSNLYKGISEEGWADLTSELGDLSQKRLTFVFAHKTPFHPQSSHIMGEDSPEVAEQANELMAILEGQRDRGTESIEEIKEQGVDGFFSGDIHFFASYQSPNKVVKITTIGAVASERNFQGPRFAILTVYDDYSWEVEDIEIR